MQDKQKEVFQSRLQGLKSENDSLKEKLISRKKEHMEVIRSLSRSETLLNSMPAGLIIIQNGKILKTNDTFLEYLGYTEGDIIGIEFLDLIHGDERDYIKKIHKLWDSGRMTPDRYDTRIVTSAGTPGNFEIRCKRIRFQNRTAFLLTVNDLKARLDQEYEKTREEKGEALLTMSAGVKDKLRDFNDTILETIKEYKASLRSGNRDIGGLMEKLEGASKKAIEVIDELEIIAGTEKKKQISLPFILNEAVKVAVQSADRMYRERAEHQDKKASIKTYLRSSSLIEGDFKNITDAIRHIITNALEAMSDAGDIYITTEENIGDAHVYIQDNGTGIPEGLKDRIFDPFFTTKKDAMGLGLSMSCAIVKKHGGDIEFTSREGEGSIFHIRLPLARRKPTSKAKGCRKKIADSQIMIIQENDVVRELLSHLLKVKGCRVTKAAKATDGIVKLKNKSFDIIIADEASLDMGQAAFIEKVRKVIAKLPIVLIAESNSKTDISSKYGHEPDLIIKKPVDVNSAIKQISEVLLVRK